MLMRKREQKYFNRQRIKKLAHYFAYFDVSHSSIPNRTIFFSYKSDSGTIVEIEVDRSEDVIVPITKECYAY